MRKISYFINIGITITAVVISGCRDEGDQRVAISAIPVNVALTRFDSLFAHTPKADFPSLRNRYPFFLPGDDSVWLNKKEDTLQLEIWQQVDSAFGDFAREKRELRALFQHLQYYFPQRPLPQVYTLTTDVDYAYRVIWTDSMLLLGLDNYLGSGHYFYRSLPRYVRSELDRDYLVVDVAQAFASRSVPPPSGRSFLERMVYYGKLAYMVRALAPDLAPGQELHYDSGQWDWAVANEEQIWAHFVNGEYLFSTDTRLVRDFLSPAPFSKFGLELDRESPPRIGMYVGYRIVSAYMQKTGADLATLPGIDAQALFAESNYKPKRNYGNP